ncbi:MAG TPA: zf-HC2 domain-containing protein [Solirubrobacterales bacterium]|nr:zf-HC2 domain-containing protein [Solirubrobacterales bacterium]
MPDRAGCEEIRALAPELALGTAAGDDRARALGHLAGCGACRRHVEELSSLADELLLLAPAEEPPAGFESRVLRELEPRPERRRPRALVPALAAVAAGIAAAAAAWVASGDDRDLASRYRDTLATADGKYLAAAPLTAPGGQRAGTVFGYEGEPSWVLVAVYEGNRPSPGRYRVQAITERGERLRLRPVRVTREGGSSGEAIPLHFHEVSEVRLLGRGRGNVLEAEF